MPKITVAKTAGFCFGVNRAINLAEELADSGEKVCTLGPIIHNNQMVSMLEKKGVRTAKNELDRAKEYDYIVVNDDLEMAVEELKNIILSERHKIARNGDILENL